MRNLFLLVLCLLAACCWARPEASPSDPATRSAHLDAVMVPVDGLQVQHANSTPKTVHGGAFEMGFANPHLIAVATPSVHVRSYMAEGIFSPDRARPCVATDAVAVSPIRDPHRFASRSPQARVQRSGCLTWRDLQLRAWTSTSHPTITATDNTWSA